MAALSKSEVFEIAREYLSGLVEESPIKDVFADLVKHVAGATTPPSAEPMVVPDPDQLKKAALTDLSHGVDPATVAAAAKDSPMNAAADLIETQVGQENGGDCVGCDSGGGGGQEEGDVPGDDPIVVEDGG